LRSIDGRLSKLEHRLGITRSETRYLLILTDAGKDPGPAGEAYIKSLDDAGLLGTGGFVMVDLTKLPDSRNAEPSSEVDERPAAHVIRIRLVDS